MNSTLTNGLKLLQVLADAPHPHSVSELARDSGLPKSHIHRLLQTLVENHYVMKTDDRRYGIGVGAFRLGHALLKNLPARNRFLPAMQEAVSGIDLPLTLALPFQTQAISVAHVFQDGRIRNTSETLGTVLSAHTTALGKLFLAHHADAERSEAIDLLDLHRGGPKAYRTKESFQEELNRIREQHYSLNNEETGVGRASLGIPVLDEKGNLIAGIGLSGSTDDILPRIPELLALLQSLVENTADHPDLTP